MAELVIKIPGELEKEIEELKEENWSEVALKAIELRAFELKLEKSRKLRHALFKALISESKLTEEDAMELGRKANEEMLAQLKEKGLV
ncbi:MAG: hypothetical protein KAT65_28540 [Methanophagales archaeon]|jgi:hypothetical protein|nr:hypothetical protein [Methanophagales archaeon]